MLIFKSRQKYIIRKKEFHQPTFFDKICIISYHHFCQNKVDRYFTKLFFDEKTIIYDHLCCWNCNLFRRLVGKIIFPMEQFPMTSDGHVPSEIVISEGKLPFSDHLCPSEMRGIVVVYHNQYQNLCTWEQCCMVLDGSNATGRIKSHRNSSYY